MDSTYLFERDSLGRYVGPPGVPFPAKGTPEVPLKPYDNVLILRQPEFDFQRVVSVTGQVRFPGTYSLRTKTDRLADVIARSGGFPRDPFGIHRIKPLPTIGLMVKSLSCLPRTRWSRFLASSSCRRWASSSFGLKNAVA